MKQGLALSPPAAQIAFFAVLDESRDVPRDPAPALNLARVVVAAATRVVAAVPLEPAPRILRVDPSLAPPLRQRLRRVNAEVIDSSGRDAPRRVWPLQTSSTEISRAIGQVFSTEHAEREHLFRRELGFEAFRKVSSGRLRPVVDVTVLHLVVDDYSPIHARSHRQYSPTARQITTFL